MLQAHPAHLHHHHRRSHAPAARNQPAGTDPDPLATSIAFGLTAATLVALFLVPANYCIRDDFKLLGKLHNKTDATPADMK
jgi:hypothetical protein